MRLAQELVVTQTPGGQVAPSGQAATGVQVQVGTGWALAAPLNVTPLGFPLHSSAVV